MNFLFLFFITQKGIQTETDRYLSVLRRIRFNTYKGPLERNLWTTVRWNLFLSFESMVMTRASTDQNPFTSSVSSVLNFLKLMSVFHFPPSRIVFSNKSDPIEIFVLCSWTVCYYSFSPYLSVLTVLKANPSLLSSKNGTNEKIFSLLVNFVLFLIL